eukprot:s1261_g5.t1
MSLCPKLNPGSWFDLFVELTLPVFTRPLANHPEYFAELAQHSKHGSDAKGGLTPLHHACRAKRDDVIRALLDARADAQQKSAAVLGNCKRFDVYLALGRPKHPDLVSQRVRSGCEGVAAYCAAVAAGLEGRPKETLPG